MQISEIEIDKIKPDPNQPRKTIGDEDLWEMACSIISQGVINPIEIDKDFVIVTGERRWRAAKLAGLKTVPVKVIDVGKNERILRQLQENIHQKTMAPLDMALALDKIRKQVVTSAAEVKKGSGGFRQGRPGINEVHELIGMPESTISEYLDLLGFEGEMKEALKDPNFSRSKVASLKEAPVKYQKELEHFVATQKSIPRDTVRHLATALRRADKFNEGDKAKELLSQNFEGLSTLDAQSKINKVIPDEETRMKGPADAARFVSRKIIELMEVLEKHPLSSLDGFSGSLVKKDLNNLGAFLQRYFHGREKEEIVKITTDKLTK